MSQALLFEHFRVARARRNVVRQMPALAASALFTASLLFAMWAKGIWDTEQLERPKHLVDLAIAPAPPPPPPPPAGGQKPADAVIVPKVTVRTIIQPPKIEQHVERPSEQGPGDPNGKDGGQLGGTGDNLNAPITSDEPPPKLDPPPEVPKKPPVVPPSVLEASRISGEKLIEPDDVTKTEIQRSGQALLVGTFKLCISPEGAVTSVTLLKPTGFPAYDRHIETTIANEWRYRPFLVEGKPTAACTAVTFKYSQH